MQLDGEIIDSLQHDFPANCISNLRTGGHYLMHPQGGKAFSGASDDLSRCSLRNISNVMINLANNFGTENCMRDGEYYLLKIEYRCT